MSGERLFPFNASVSVVDTELPKVPSPHHRSSSRGQRNRVRIERWQWRSEKQHGLSNAVEHYSPFIPRDSLRGNGIKSSRESGMTTSFQMMLSEETIQKLVEACSD